MHVQFYINIDGVHVQLVYRFFGEFWGKKGLDVKIIQPIVQSDQIRVCMPNIRLIRAAVKPAFRHEHTDKQTDCNFIYIDIYI